MTDELIVEADGGLRGDPGLAAGRVVVLDPATDAVLAEVGECVDVATDNATEYRSMLAAAVNGSMDRRESFVRDLHPLGD